MPHAPYPMTGKRGFAVLVVLGLALLILVYLITAHGAIEQTAIQGRASKRQQAAAEKLTMAVTLAMAQNPVRPSGDYKVSRRPLPAADPLWAALPLLKPLAGDELLTIEVSAGVRDAAPLRTRLIVNRQARRPAPIILDRAS